MIRRFYNIRLYVFLDMVLGVVFVCITLLILLVSMHETRIFLLDEAEQKADLMLGRNLAIHAYFNQQLKPDLFLHSGDPLYKQDFAPSWMSSTYAVREIDALFRRDEARSLYYYKEVAINARSPQNEADPFERAFLEALNRDPTLERSNTIRVLDGVPYFVSLLRGERMEAACLRCHSTPDAAPAGMLAIYGDQRSFGRQLGETISAVSIRIPLAVAYQSAALLSTRILLVTSVVLLLLGLVLRRLMRRVLLGTLETVRLRAQQVASGQRRIGDQIPLPFGYELRAMTGAFNQLSLRLSQEQDALEERVRARTGELAQSQQFIQQILDLTPAAMCLLDTRLDRFLYFNQNMRWFFNVSDEVLREAGEAFALDFIHPEDRPRYQELRQALEPEGICLEEGEGVSDVLRIREPRGGYMWIDFRILVVEREERGRLAKILFVGDDITEKHEALQRLHYTSTHDGLSGLYNWAYFEETSERWKQEDVFPLCIVIMDVDDLKRINDTYGHAAGDHLLRVVSGVLRSAFCETDVVARLGGDEFGALMPNVEENLPEAITARLRARLKEATLIPGQHLDVISIGVCVAQDAASLDDARHLADKNMYEDKKRRKNGTISKL